MPCKSPQALEKKRIRDLANYYLNHEENKAAARARWAERKEDENAKARARRAKRAEWMRQYRAQLAAEKMVIAKLTAFLKSNMRCAVENMPAVFGYGREELKAHIERMFQPGMTWANMGKAWSIDHVIPVASFDLSKRENFLACHSLANLVPLWRHQNTTKGAAVTKLI